MKEDSDEQINRLLSEITACEILTKTAIFEYAAEKLTNNSDKIALVTCVSMSAAAAALHAASEAVKNNGDKSTGEMALGIYQTQIQPELIELLRALGMMEKK